MRSIPVLRKIKPREWLFLEIQAVPSYHQVTNQKRFQKHHKEPMVVLIYQKLRHQNEHVLRIQMIQQKVKNRKPRQECD